MEMKLTGVRIPDEMKAAATSRAKMLRRSFGNYLRDLIANDLEKSGNAELGLADASEDDGKKKIVNAVNQLKKNASKKK